METSDWASEPPELMVELRRHNPKTRAEFSFLENEVIKARAVAFAVLQIKRGKTVSSIGGRLAGLTDEEFWQLVEAKIKESATPCSE